MTCKWDNGTLVTINETEGVYKVVGNFTVSSASASGSKRNSRQRKCKYELKKKQTVF